MNKTRMIHIVGSGPRSGTTLMQEIIRSCCDVTWSPPHELSIKRRPVRYGGITLTKDPGDTLFISEFLKRIDELYVIYMMRDPRDVICSKHRLSPEKYWCSLRYWNLFTKIYEDKLRDSERVTLVKYEDLVLNPRAVETQLRDFLPFLEFNKTLADYHKGAKPSAAALQALGEVRSIDSSSVGNWRKNLSRVKSQLAMHGDISGDLIRCGYESDRKWLKSLDTVEVLDEETHWPEFFSDDDLNQRRRGVTLAALLMQGMLFVDRFRRQKLERTPRN